tara:strand:- start:10 stop:492 length:483 start_codon:yes stop_codon:yes gene_type:complete
MNKKNITYCSLAILTIVIVASTANGTTKNYNPTNKSSMTTKAIDKKGTDYSLIEGSAQQDNTSINESPNEVNSEPKNKLFTDSNSYTKTELNRALMYQNKSWAKDDTINEDAWIAAQAQTSPKILTTTNANVVVGKSQQINEKTSTISTQDSKNNSAMVE